MAVPEKYARLISLSKRVYRLLLAAYPKEFRQEYGSDMVQLFRDQCRDELGSGGILAWIALWFRTFVELIRSTRRERERARLGKVPCEREPKQAVAWSLTGGLMLCPGLGQIYNYQTSKGLALLSLYLVLFPLIAITFSDNFTTILLIAGVIWVWSVWDAHRVAKRTNAYFTTE